MQKDRSKLSLTLALVLTAIIAAVPMTTYGQGQGFDKHGGYADEIVYLPILTQDAQFLALNTGEVAMYDGFLAPELIPEARQSEFIELNQTRRAGFGHYSMNNQLFPTNVSGFRRAVASVLDKNFVNQELLQGFSIPIDVPTPVGYYTDFWSIEDDLPFHYYDRNIQRARDELEASGFVDVDGDGWREFDPDGDGVGADLDGDGTPNDVVTLEARGTAGIPLIEGIAQNVADGMNEAGIQTSVFLPDFGTLINDWLTGRSNFVFFAWTNLNPESPASFLRDLFHSESTFNQGSYRYSNPDFDEAIDACVEAPTVEEAAPHCKDAQQELFEDQPIIPIYNNLQISAFRTDKWEGWINYNGLGVSDGFWNEYKVKLEEGESARRDDGTGGTFRRMLGSDPSSFNQLSNNEAVMTYVLNQLYDGFYTRHPYTLEKMPWFAENWQVETPNDPATGQEVIEITLNLIENATWHNGDQWNAWDVPFAYFISLYSNSPYFEPSLQNFMNVTVVDDYTVKIYGSSTGHLEFVRLAGLYCTCFPTEVWGDAATYGQSGFSPSDVDSLIMEFGDSDWDGLMDSLSALFSDNGVTSQEILAFEPGNDVDNLLGTGPYMADEFNFGSFYAVTANPNHPFSVRAQAGPGPGPGDEPGPGPGPVEPGEFNPISPTGRTFDPLTIDLDMATPFGGSVTLVAGLGVVALIVGVAIGIVAGRSSEE